MKVNGKDYPMYCGKSKMFETTNQISYNCKMGPSFEFAFSCLKFQRVNSMVDGRYNELVNGGYNGL